MKLDEILRKDQYLYSLSNGGVSFCQFLLFPSFFYDFNNLSMPIANRAKSADFARQKSKKKKETRKMDKMRRHHLIKNINIDLFSKFHII